MRIAGGVSIPVRSADTRDVLSIIMIKKSMDSMKEASTAMNQLIEKSVNPNLGKKIDVKV